MRHIMFDDKKLQNIYVFCCRVNKIKICESEASETQYWIEVIVKAKWLSWEKIKPEYDECSELLAIFTSIGKRD